MNISLLTPLTHMKTGNNHWTEIQEKMHQMLILTRSFRFIKEEKIKQWIGFKAMTSTTK